MKKHLIPAVLLVYSVFLIKVMVFKDVPLIKVGQLMLNFGGTAVGEANFVPLKTIVPYLLGYKGWIIAGINLVGNIALLVPIGFLVPFVYRNMTWKKTFILAAASGLAIEVVQTLLHVGIFDIDDVILNAFGVMIGYFAFLTLEKWVRLKNYKSIVIASIAVVVAFAAALYSVYPHNQSIVNPGPKAHQNSGDLCGGTGGNGQIISLGDNTFTMERKDGSSQNIKLREQATIKTPTGPGSTSDLKTGDRVTLVGDPNPDGSFSADAVFICN